MKGASSKISVVCNHNYFICDYSLTCNHKLKPAVITVVQLGSSGPASVRDLIGISYLNIFTFLLNVIFHSILPTFVMAAVGYSHLICVAFVCPEVKPYFHLKILLLCTEICVSWSLFSPGRS